MLNAATVVLTIPLVATMWFSITVSIQHFSLGWPVHAQHHLVSEIVTTVGICAVSLLLIYIPFRDGEVWSVWALLLAGLVIYGSYWLGNVTVGLGEVDAGVRNITWALETVLFGVGVVLAFMAI